MFTCSKCAAKYRSFYNMQSHEARCNGLPTEPIPVVSTKTAELDLRSYLITLPR